MYNCPKNITYIDLSKYYERSAEVTNFRFVESDYSDTWMVFVSFKSLSDAKKALKVKGSFKGYYSFKHLACEKIMFDEEYTVCITSERAMSEQQIYNGLVGGGPIEFIIKEDKNKAIVIFRDHLLAKRTLERRTISGVPVKIRPYLYANKKDQQSNKKKKPLSLAEMIELQKSILQEQKQKVVEPELDFSGSRRLRREMRFAELQKEKEIEAQMREKRRNEREKMERQERIRDRQKPNLQNMSLDEAVNMELKGGLTTDTIFNNFPSLDRNHGRDQGYNQFNNSSAMRNEMFDDYNAPRMRQEYNPIQEDYNPPMGEKFEMYARNPQVCPPISTFLSILNEAENPPIRNRSVERRDDRMNFSRRSRSRSRHRSPSPDLDRLERELRRKEEAINRRLAALDNKLKSSESIERTDTRRRKSNSREFDDIVSQKQLIQDELEHIQRKNVRNYPPSERELYLVDKMRKLNERQDKLREVRRRRASATRGPSPRPRSLSNRGVARYRAKRDEDNLLFVANIASEVSQEDIERIFKKYGHIIRFDLTQTKRGGREAYIEYSRATHAKKACEMNQVLYNNKRLRVSLSSNKPKNKEGYTICIEWTTKRQVLEEDLYKTFEHYGQIDFVRLNEAATTRFATVRFKLMESCDRAALCTELVNGIHVDCRKYKDFMPYAPTPTTLTRAQL